MKHEKLLVFRSVLARIDHHIKTVETKLELGTAKCDLEPHIEILCLLHEKARHMSGGTLETSRLGEKIAELAAKVDAIPHLQLVR